MNILLNNYCNLRCPYCFAEDVMHKNTKQSINIYDIKWLLEFIKESNMHDVRLIGGEPTLHPDFHKILIECAEKDFIKDIMLFTNGTFSKDINYLLKLLSKDKKIHLLVNLNSVEDIGQEKYNIILNNIATLREYVEITVGINLYKVDQDYQYIIDVAKSFNIKNIRWALVVPNTLEKANSDVHDYFNKMIPVVTDFLQSCAINELFAKVDCNNIPLCMLPDDILRLIAMVAPQNLKTSVCNPVVDVKPDLTAIRCFAMNEEVVDIKKFKNLEGLTKHFIDTIDSKYVNKPLFNECSQCASYQINNKSCACLAFRKSGDISNGKS